MFNDFFSDHPFLGLVVDFFLFFVFIVFLYYVFDLEIFDHFNFYFQQGVENYYNSHSDDRPSPSPAFGSTQIIINDSEVIINVSE